MVLAEALLRVPDAATADRLIEDKLATGDWASADVQSNALLVSASAWTLGVTARLIQPGETPDTILESLLKRLGVPAVRVATRQAMRLLGSHFVLGQTIEEALERAGGHQDPAIPSTCWARARARWRTPSAIGRLCRRHRCHRRGRRGGGAAEPSRHFGQALRAPPSLRSGLALARAGRACAQRARTRPQGARPRSQFHRRCRGGRPARAHARRDCRGAARPVAARLGGVWACRAGLSEARPGGDRLARRHGARARPPADGPAGQGRLLGHRGQTRPGARALPTIRCSPARP